jgi:hypothetical protein
MTHLCLHYCSRCGTEKYAEQGELPQGWDRLLDFKFCEECMEHHNGELKKIFGDEPILLD